MFSTSGRSPVNRANPPAGHQAADTPGAHLTRDKQTTQPGRSNKTTTTPPPADGLAGRPLRWSVLLLVLALAVRALRLDWQPLWWDEGYSIYFATEPLARMYDLTAHDIHPPLYYALLHLWIAVFGAATPVILRLFSVLIGASAVLTMPWLALRLWPAHRRVAWIAALLLLLSPLHIFYSQEVRMYALAMVLGMAAGGELWQWLERPKRGTAFAYVFYAAALLYTLYYGALLLLAHAVHTLWHLRRNTGRLPSAGGLFVAVGLLYLPWLLYAGPALVGYVDDKVQSDADRPLGIIGYWFRHAVAFAGGHLPADDRAAFLIWGGRGNPLSADAGRAGRSIDAQCYPAVGRPESGWVPCSGGCRRVWRD